MPLPFGPEMVTISLLAICRFTFLTMLMVLRAPNSRERHEDAFPPQKDLATALSSMAEFSISEVKLIGWLFVKISYHSLMAFSAESLESVKF